MSYTALYRKYRPRRFSEVLGQERVVKTLKNQIVSGKVSHAYLFCGTRGTGKTTIAKIFAKAINCVSPDDGEPCGVCALCTDISEERGFNVIEIDAASNNGVDNIREIRDEVKYTPTEGVYKVYIIDEVHMLSGGAFNALLKTLEEPPAHVIFILATTDPGKIPATIHSRCQRYDFRRISANSIAERIFEYLDLEGVSADNEAVFQIARLSDGSMRDALSILDRCVSYYVGENITLLNVLDVTGSIDSASFLRFTTCLNDMDCQGALLVIESVLNAGKEAGQFVVEALNHFRNIVIAKTLDDCAVILGVSEETAKEIKSQSEIMDAVRVMSYISAFSALISQVRYAANPKLLLEIEVIKLCNPEIISNNYEEIYNKILKIEKDLQTGVLVKSAPIANEITAEKQPEKKTEPVLKRVILPEDFELVSERYKEIIGQIQNIHEAFPLACMLEDTKIEFLDDKFIYIVFNDEANESLFKNNQDRIDIISEAITNVTGGRFSIKTITRSDYSAKSKGVVIERESLEKKLKNDISGIDIEIID